MSPYLVEGLARMGYQLQPPLVSIIVLNYNYGRFLRDAIESVRRQTYPHLECIVVDDASTDDSLSVLEGLKAGWPSLQVLALGVNSGQSAAALEGLARATGDYILFLDADDILFPACVASHLAVHMSSRRPVGFSCCDAVQILGERMVIARNGNISRSFRSLPEEPDLVSESALIQLAEHGIHLPTITADQLRSIEQRNMDWPWSTTSCMFFRREALELIRGAAGLRQLRIATDNFLAHAVNLLSGSIILDASLVGYRLHGQNGFNKRAALEGFLCHNRVDEHFDKTCRVFLDDLIVRFPHYSANMERPVRILEICRKIDRPDDEKGLPFWAARSRLARLLVEWHDELEPFIGSRSLQTWMLRVRVPFWIRLRLWLRRRIQEDRISSSMRDRFHSHSL